jgi:hypothetical protein
MSTALEIVVQESGTDSETALAINKALSPFFAQAQEWQVKVADVTDPKIARASRLTLKGIRVEAKKVHESLKAGVLQRSRAIDAAYKTIENAIAPLELKLDEIEKAEARAEADRRAKLSMDRAAQLQPYGVDARFFNLAEMPAEGFAQLLESSKAAHEAKAAALKKAEEDRIAAGKAEAAARAEREQIAAEERAKVQAENERLRADAAEREAAAQKEREKAARERKAAEAKAKADREAYAESVRIAEEKARAEREAAQAALRKEREAREKIEAEAKAKADAEKRRQDQELARQRAAEAAPDREKLRAFAELVRTLEVPAMSTGAGRNLAAIISKEINKLGAEIDRIADLHLNQKSA